MSGETKLVVGQRVRFLRRDANVRAAGEEGVVTRFRNKGGNCFIRSDDGRETEHGRGELMLRSYLKVISDTADAGTVGVGEFTEEDVGKEFEVVADGGTHKHGIAVGTRVTMTSHLAPRPTWATFGFYQLEPADVRRLEAPASPHSLDRGEAAKPEGRFPPQAGDVWTHVPTKRECTFSGAVTSSGCFRSVVTGGGEVNATDDEAAFRAYFAFVRYASPPPSPSLGEVPLRGATGGLIVRDEYVEDTYETRQAALVARADKAIRELRIKYGAKLCPGCGDVFDRVGKSGKCGPCYFKGSKRYGVEASFSRLLSRNHGAYVAATLARANPPKPEPWTPSDPLSDIPDAGVGVFRAWGRGS